MKGFKRYIVKGKKSLETIALNLDMNIEELRHFHNYNCKLSDLIGGNKIPRHVKEILYPANEEACKTKNNSSNNYLFEQRYTSQLLNFECNVTSFSEEIEINYKNNYSLQYFHKSEKYFYVEIKFRSFQLKNLDLLSEIKQKIYTINFPLMLVINNNGTIHDIHNFSRIKNRWLKLKKEIMSKYSKSFILDLINKNDIIYSNQKNLLKQLQNDWFLTSYFLGIYTFYSKKWEIDRVIRIPLSTSFTSFKVKQKILNHYEDKNYIISEIESYNESKNSNIFDNHKYKAHLLLDPLFRIPIKIKIDYFLNNLKINHLSISITQVTDS